MELEGFKRTLSVLQNQGITISVMATDRHVIVCSVPVEFMIPPLQQPLTFFPK